MSKRSRQEKRRAAFLEKVKGDVPIGGLFGAVHRNANGQATPSDIDFLNRMRRENKGEDGYSGVTKGASGTFSKGPKGSYLGGHTFYVPPPKEDGVFHCAEANEVTSECPLKPKVPSILIDAQMWSCLMNCTREYDTEWIALLIGRLDKDSNGEPAYVIERFYFPPQTASGTHVDVPTGIKPKPNTIGAIHSHVNMGVFFSSTDKDHSNWPVEVVINRKEEYEAVSRHQLKCGEWAKSKAKVYLTGSSLPKAIKSQLDAAFEAGKIMAKGRDSTAGVHVDDREDLYANKYGEGYNPYGWFADHKPCKACGHYSHAKAQACSALNCTCPAYVPPDPPSPSNSPKEEVCPISNCIREKGHVGWHRTSGNSYFEFVPGESKKDEPSKGEPKQLSLTVPSSDDSPFQIGDEYCQDCTGEGMVEEFDVKKGLWNVATCSTCKGDGLSELGRVRKADTKGVVQ